MAISTVEMEVSGAESIAVTDSTLTAVLVDGRAISVPLAWYPRLVHATPEERNNWELHADNRHVHWPDLDEDLSIESLLVGRKSGETPKSFNRWLEAKKAGRGVELHELQAAEHTDRRGDG